MRGNWIHNLYGTAFFINGEGAFLTASHVLKAAQKTVEGNGRQLALVVKGIDGASEKSFLAPIETYEHAPEPYDVSAGRVAARSPTYLRLRPFEIAVWRDVAAFGYPESAIARQFDDLRLNLRALKGYVQRLTRPGDLPLGEHPAGYELSFNISPGLSRAPVFIHEGQTDLLIGVAVSSVRSELIDASITEVNDNGQEYTERRVRIEEYGFAHDIRGLLDWRPSIFHGLSLNELNLSPVPLDAADS